MLINELEITLKPLKDLNGKVYKEQWPFLGELKAISPSTLTMPLSDLIYGIKPPIFHSGMQDGIDFENIIALVLEGMKPEKAITYIENIKMKERVLNIAPEIYKIEGINNMTYCSKNDIGYANHKIFIGCETDLFLLKEKAPINSESEGIILEMKKTNTKYYSLQKRVYIKYMYYIQCYIQQLCFPKAKIYLCWASDTFTKIKEFNIDKLKHKIEPIFNKLVQLHKMNSQKRDPVKSFYYREIAMKDIKEFIDRKELENWNQGKSENQIIETKK